MMGTTIKCDLLFNGIMWSAPGWWKLRPIRPVKEKKKKETFYKRGETWKSVIKATFVDRHFFKSSILLSAMGKRPPWWNVKHEMHKQQAWHNGRRDDHRKQTWKMRWKKISFVVTDLLHTHKKHTKNKASYKSRNSTESAFCYGDNVCMLQGPICQCFPGEGSWCGTSEWKLSWLSLSSYSYRWQQEKHTQGLGRNSLPG